LIISFDNTGLHRWLWKKLTSGSLRKWIFKLQNIILKSEQVKIISNGNDFPLKVLCATLYKFIPQTQEADKSEFVC